MAGIAAAQPVSRMSGPTMVTTESTPARPTSTSSPSGREVGSDRAPQQVAEVERPAAQAADAGARDGASLASGS